MAKAKARRSGVDYKFFWDELVKDIMLLATRYGSQAELQAKSFAKQKPPTSMSELFLRQGAADLLSSNWRTATFSRNLTEGLNQVQNNILARRKRR